MNVIDNILTEWAYRCPDGIVDMNNPKKKAILDEVLKEYGLLLEEEATKTIEDEILDTIVPLNDEEKKKVLGFIKNKFKEEIKDHSKLEKKIEDKVGNPNTADVISAFAVKSKEDDELLEYLSSDKQLSFDLGNKTGELLTILKPTGFSEVLLSKIIKFTPSEKGRSLGVGEIALELFFRNAKKASTGDINVDGKLVELKGSEARFPSTGIAKGREGDIKGVYNNLKKEYPNVEPPTDFSVYIENILKSSKEEGLKYINDILNEIYPNSANIGLNVEDTSDIIYGKLIKKYLTSYTKDHPDNSYYMLISSDSPFNYSLYTTEEFINNSGNLSFKNITTSTAYPNLLLGKDKEKIDRPRGAEKVKQSIKQRDEKIAAEIEKEPETQSLKKDLDDAKKKLDQWKEDNPKKEVKPTNVLLGNFKTLEKQYDDHIKNRTAELNRVREQQAK